MKKPVSMKSSPAVAWHPDKVGLLKNIPQATCMDLGTTHNNTTIVIQVFPL